MNESNFVELGQMYDHLRAAGFGGEGSSPRFPTSYEDSVAVAAYDQSARGTDPGQKAWKQINKMFRTVSKSIEQHGMGNRS